MVSFLVSPRKVSVAGLAIGHGLGLRFLKMARVAGHRHHGRGSGNVVTRNAVQRRTIARAMAEVTEYLGVFAF